MGTPFPRDQCRRYGIISFACWPVKYFYPLIYFCRVFGEDARPRRFSVVVTRQTPRKDDFPSPQDHQSCANRPSPLRIESLLSDGSPFPSFPLKPPFSSLTPSPVSPFSSRSAVCEVHLRITRGYKHTYTAAHRYIFFALPFARPALKFNGPTLQSSLKPPLGVRLPGDRSMVVLRGARHWGWLVFVNLTLHVCVARDVIVFSATVSAVGQKQKTQLSSKVFVKSNYARVDVCTH